MNRKQLTNQCIYLLKYALSSLLVIVFDFGIYAALSYNGWVSPGLANAVTSPVACSAGWFIAGKTIFRSNRIRHNGYLVWGAYIILGTVVYSIIIQSLVWLGFDKYMAKILMLGISFCISSSLFKYVILKRFSRAIA